MLAILLFQAVCAYGQAVSATLLGVVTDSSGAVIANAKVTITEVGTGVSHTSQANESGNYTFPDLPPGSYTVTIEAAGFKRETRTGVDVIVNSSVRVDAQLQPGNVSESVEVTGAPPTLETDRADTGRKIETIQVEAMPLGANRNFEILLNLVPGTTRATFDHSQFFNAASSLQTEVNGQLRQGNNYQIEGIDDNDATGNLQLLIPPIEAIQTVDVSTSNFEAELGRASGAVTNVILKSGTNSIHGAAYEFLQNTDLDARSFFNPSVGQVHYNYFGGNVGGPIKKNKIFFFGDYLRVEDHEANANLGTIPSVPFTNGDLSAAPTVIYNPFTSAADGTGRTPFPGSQIPLSLINPISAKIMALLPAPNQTFNPRSPANNYFALLPFTKDSDSFDIKIDDNATDKDRLSGRFSFARPDIYQAPIFGSLQEATFRTRGTFTFGEAQTSIPGATTGFGNDFASFLLDQPSQVGRDLTTYFPGYRAWQFFTFVQDKWVVTPKLTLDLGVRWEFYPPLTPQFPGSFSNYDSANNTLVIAGVGGNPSNLGIKTRYDYFAPRFGAAYRLTASTVIRAGSA